MVMDIPVRLTLEVGGSDMPIRDLLQLHQGAIVELDRQAGEPLDVLVNGTLIARGEVVVIEDKLGIRLTEVVSQTERLQSLR
jgi:flagellar motor switch protein FliN/FliY